MKIILNDQNSYEEINQDLTEKFQNKNNIIKQLISDKNIGKIYAKNNLKIHNAHATKI